MSKIRIVVCLALASCAMGRSGGLFPFQPNYYRSFEDYPQDSTGERDRYRAHPMYGHLSLQSRVGNEIDLLFDLMKTALILAAPLAAAWQGMLAFQKSSDQGRVQKRIHHVEVSRHLPKVRASIYSILYSAGLFAAEFGILFSMLEYSKHYIFSFPKEMQLPSFLALWIFIALGSKLIAAIPATISNLLRLPRPAVAISEAHVDDVRKPSWTISPIALYLFTIPLCALQAVAVSDVWENAGYQTGMQAVMWYLAQISLSDLWSKTFTEQRQFGYSLLLALPWLATSIATAWAFYEVSPVAGYMFVPTVLWVLLTGVMNHKYWKLNGKMPLYPIRVEPPRYF